LKVCGDVTNIINFILNRAVLLLVMPGIRTLREKERERETHTRKGMMYYITLATHQQYN